MLERCRKLEKGLVGPRSERLSGDESQLTIGVLETLLSERDLAEIDELAKANEQEVKAHKRKKPTGRKPLPDHLPRVDIEVLPEEVQREGLDAFDRIGEVLERRPASMAPRRRDETGRSAARSGASRH